MTSIERRLKRLQTAEISTPTPRDRLPFGILDNNIRDRLLRETNQTLKKTYEICRASESMLNQIKAVVDNAGALVNAINQNESEQKFSTERGNFKGKYLIQRNMATAVGHMTPTKGSHVTPMERRVEKDVKQTILLPNVAVGEIITQANVGEPVFNI